MTEPYDFEFRLAPSAVCNRCGALVQNRKIHDAWHEQALTREQLADIVDRVRMRGVQP